MSGVIEYASQDVCHSPRDSYTDDILKLLNATKYRIESLNLEQTSEQSKSAELFVNKNAKKLRPETIEEVTGKEVEIHNVEEDEIEKASRSSDAMVSGNERDGDAEEGELVLGIDSQKQQRAHIASKEQQQTRGGGNQKLIFIKCKEMSSFESQNDKVMDGDAKMLRDVKKRQTQEGLLTSDDKTVVKKEARYSCGGCGSKFFDRDELKVHMENAHMNEDVRVIGIGCKPCEDGEVHPKCDFDKKFTVKQKIGDSKDPLVFLCDACDHKSSQSRYMQKHISAVHLKEVKYSCNTCNYKSFYGENATKHLRIHKDVGAKLLSIKCKQCQTQVIHDKNALCINENNKTIVTPEYACAACDFKTSKKIFLNAHKKATHTKEVRYSCNMCTYKAFHFQSLRSHVAKIHETDFGFRSCSKCEYKTSKSRYMFKHIQLNHSENKLLQEKILHCNDCEYETKTSKAMKTHTDMVHKKIVKFGCSKCSRKSLLMGCIKRHMRRSHKEAKVISYDCKQCANKTNHLECDTQPQNKREQGDKNIKCKTCNFFSDKKSKIIRHERVVHQKKQQFSCNMCDYKCSNKYSIRRHMNLKHNVGEAVKTYQQKKKRANENYNKDNHDSTLWNQHCKFCDFSSNKTGLRDHMNSSHPLEKLFKCDKCAYKCNWQSNLNMHTRSKHEKVKVFCKECSYTSTWKVALLYHMRLKHGIFQRNTKYKELLEFQESICENCGFAGTSKMSMKLHSKSGCDRWV